MATRSPLHSDITSDLRTTGRQSHSRDRCAGATDLYRFLAGSDGHAVCFLSFRTTPSSRFA